MKKILNHTLFKNSFSLVFLQVVTYLTPFLIIPLLYKNIGEYCYGVYATIVAFVAFSNMITDYGFSLYGVYFVAKNSMKKRLINELLTSSLLIRLLLFVFIFVFMLVFVLFTETHQNFLPHFILGFGASVLYSCQPLWFFQGIEKIKLACICTVLSKAIFLLLVLVFVKKPNDFVLVFWFLLLGNFVALVLSHVFIKMLGFKYVFCKFPVILNHFVESSQFFLSRVAVILYTSGCVIIVSFFAGPVAAGKYQIAEQFYKAIQFIFMPLNQALFPYMAHRKDYQLFYKLLTGAVILILLAAVIAWIFFPWFLNLYLHQQDEFIISVFNVFVLVSVVNVPAVLLGYSFFSAKNKIEYANRSVIYGCIIFTVSNGMFYFLYGFNDFTMHVALSVLLTELFVFIYRLNFSIKISINQ